MEVLATIRFTTPCLGNIRGKVNRMLRNPDGKVIFMQTWWRAGLGYAADALGKFQNDVTKIQADPVIEGCTTTFKRYYGPKDYQEHEAFETNAIIKAKFSLPARVNIEAFYELLDMAGRYVGISPYGYKEDFGRFVVVEVVPVRSIKGEGGK